MTDRRRLRVPDSDAAGATAGSCLAVLAPERGPRSVRLACPRVRLRHIALASPFPSAPGSPS